MVGGAFGARRGLLSGMAYVLVGVAGAPVFAGGASGPGAVWSASGGYRIGMVAAACVLGVAADRGWDRRLLSSVLAMLVGSATIYLVGASWLAVELGLDPRRADLGVAPFVAGDALKLCLAGFALPGAWRLVSLLSADAG
nr:biotin transporter BioY [Micromonospora inositola]